MIEGLYDKEVQLKVEDLDSLKERHEELATSIKELKNIYKLDPSIFTPEIWFGLTNTSKPNQTQNDSLLGIFDLRAKFRDEHNLQIKRLRKIDKEIFLNNIDVLLAKIDCILKPEEE